MNTTRDDHHANAATREIESWANSYAIALVDSEELPAAGVACHCQACGARLAVVGGSSSSDDPSTILTTDGHAIPEFGNLQLAGSGGAAFAMTGHCVVCGIPHWFLEIEMNRAGVAAAIDRMGDVRSWHRELIVPGNEKMPVWTVLETEDGEHHVHSIGPLLPPFWRHAADCVQAILPRAEAVQRLLVQRRALLRESNRENAQ